MRTAFRPIMVTELLQVGPYMKRPWTLVLGAIALLAGAYVVPAARAESPLDDLIARKIGNSACFTRVYDADHLRKHPKQTTTSMAVWLAYEELPGVPEGLALGLGLAISRKGDSLPLFAQGGLRLGRARQSEHLGPPHDQGVQEG